MGTGIEMSARGGTEIVVVASAVGDEVVAPVIEHPTVRVGKTVGHVTHEFSRSRLVAINRAVGVADRAIEGLDVGAMKHAVAQINRTAGFEAH